MAEVFVQNIYWADENDNEVNEAVCKRLGLPKEEVIDLDSKDGDWSEAGLEQQCYDFLDKKYESTGMHASLIFVDYPL